MNIDPYDLITFLKQTAEGEPEIVREAIDDSNDDGDPPSVNRFPHSRKDGNPDYSSGNIEEKSISTPIIISDPALSSLATLSEVEEVALACTRCRLATTRTKVVFGVGYPAARLMFIGEGPGDNEDRTGEPFVGQAGQLLNKIIAAMKLSREQVYIANIVKCRPPNNRNPEADEVAACTPYLVRQIDLIKPEHIVALGLVAAKRLLNLDPTATIKSLRGRTLDFQNIPLTVTYHPAALLRNPALKVPTWEDMQRVMRLMGLL